MIVFKVMAAAMGAVELPNAPGYYANHDGLVFSSRKRKPSIGLRLLKPGRHTLGYCSYGICVDGRTVSMKGHRIVADCFMGSATPELPVVRHLNGDPRDNRLVNLERSTQLENIQDKWRHGTMATGARNGTRTKPDSVLRGDRSALAKLSSASVVEIKAAILAGERGVDIAKRFGVVKTTIAAIKSGRNWAHISATEKASGE